MGLPSSFSQRKELYRDVRKGMGIREDRDMGDMTDQEHLRDLYLTGKIWNAGDIIEARGIKGEIIRKGANYVSFADDDGKVHKCWIHEIQLNEASALDRLMKFDKSRVAAGKTPIFTDKKGNEFVRMKKSGQMTTMNVPMDQVGKFEKKGYVLAERNYAKEYANYQGTPEQIARRSSRNKARRVMGDKTKIGMDVGHKDNNPLNNDPKNLRNEVPSDNRREPRLREAPDHRKDYETFVKMYAQLNKALDDAAAKLKKFPKGDMGMTPDKVKSSPAYKKAKTDFEKASNLTKRFLKGVPKDFMKKNARSRREEVDETWYNDIAAKMSQITHPKGWSKITQKYADGMKDPEHRKHPGAWAGEVARQTGQVNGRQFVKYINLLVTKGKLPKELKAEYEPQMSFKQFVEAISQDIAYTSPNFDMEWDEAIRYKEFKNIGKEKWIALAKKGKVVEYNTKTVKKINNTDAGDTKQFNKLHPEKQKRALQQIRSGSVELPIVASYSDDYLDLVGGNTRLTAAMKVAGKGKVWQFDVPDNIIQDS
jgi:hypothetical protein